MRYIYDMGCWLSNAVPQKTDGHTKYYDDIDQDVVPEVLEGGTGPGFFR